MGVDTFGLGLLRWVRESVLSSKAPHRERVKFGCWMETRTERGKGRREYACLDFGMTKRGG